MKNLAHSLFYSFAFLLCFSSCQESSLNKELIHGTWKVKKWKIESTGKVINNKMDMSFGTDGMYNIDYGSESEKGKYWISGENLHTVETGKAEKKVKILKLATDTLRIQMNRAGQLELVTLLKDK